MYKLYLDDIRNPKTDDWIIVRNYDEFVNVILELGLPNVMSLDHDLGEELEGYDCVKWLVYEKQYDLRNIIFIYHTANPVGKDNMEYLVNNWNKHLNNLVK